MVFNDNPGASDPDQTTHIEAWFRQLEGAGNEENDFVRPNLEGIMSRTPSPTKRSRITDSMPDFDVTPRRTALGTIGSSLVETSYGDTSDSQSIMTGSSRRGSASPKKRELELRLATEFPLRREHISCIQSPTPLMQDIARLRAAPVIPLSMKARVFKDCSWANPPNDSWFYDTSALENEQDEAIDEYMYRRLEAIRQKTIKCKQRMEHEAGWNDAVHSSLLEVALDEPEYSDVSYRNVTQSRIYPDLRDPNPLLSDAKADYAVFLDPPDDSRLAKSLRRYRRVDPSRRRATHIQLSDEANTPVGIGIQTKSSRADGSVVGPSQLVAWTRAQFRHLESLPNAKPNDLPIIPMIFVQGASWRVEFVQRTESRMIVWEGFHIGSSDEIHGCYCIVAALRRLGRWCQGAFLPWWEQALGAGTPEPMQESERSSRGKQTL